MAPSRGGIQAAAAAPSAAAAAVSHRWLAVALLAAQLWLVTARVPLPRSNLAQRQLLEQGSIRGQAAWPVGHAAPCDDGTGGKEMACYGTDAFTAANPDAAPWCCSTTNYWCGTNSTGAPRCAVCPGVCITTCNPALGERCLLDRGCTCRPGGCWRCLQNCTKTPCAAGQVCIDGFCQTDPCTGDPCAATPSTPVCQISANFTAECIAGPECSDAKPCPAGEVCVEGACKADPCAGYECPSRNKPKCIPGDAPACQPTCVAECSDAVACPQGKVCADGGCLADPCSPNRCPSEAPDCVLGPSPDFEATCVNRCSEADPCPMGQFCANGTCRANPCLGFDCPDEMPYCLVGRPPAYAPVCISTGEIMGGSNCSPACSLPNMCQQTANLKRWRCAPPRPAPPVPRRRPSPVRRARPAAALAATATAAGAAAAEDAASADDASGESGPGPAEATEPDD
ncbi:hypothetical protein ABPG75_001502 [Micractinium tetrahymenae]